eukprot:7431256-Pyramimonas_sp.AAC.1
MEGTAGFWEAATGSVVFWARACAAISTPISATFARGPSSLSQPRAAAPPRPPEDGGPLEARRR